MSSPVRLWLAPGERRAATAAAAATAVAAGVVVAATLVAWDAGERTAVRALVVSVAALALSCAALAAYTIWLRGTLSRRTVTLLRPYLAARPASPVPADVASPSRVAGRTSAGGNGVVGQPVPLPDDLDRLTYAAGN